jgi:predicted metal-dependent phosphoesterase TrpH
LGEDNVIDGFDAIEVHNARSTKGSNRKAAKLASKMNKPVTAGSDAHHASNVGDAYAEFSDNATSWEDIVKAMIDGNAKAGGSHRGPTDSMKYGFKSISEWMRRGFKKM